MPPTSRELKELRALHTRKGRAESGRFLAEGVRVVEDLLASDLTVHWALTSSSLGDTERGRALIDAIVRRGIPHRDVSDREFDNLAATETPQGVAAVADIPRPSAERLLPGERPAVLLLLDGVQDPGNFGTLVRSAEALGAVAVVALPGTVDPWNPKSVRSAAGSSFRVPVLQLGVDAAIAEVRGLGYRLLGADVTGDPVGEARGEPIALVVGNEGAGLSAELREQVDGFVSIPLRGRAESLNVAAAAAILLYELARQ